LPPVNGFWSLTLYHKEHLFEPNALNRFSLGTKSKSLKFNPDGSLTLYYQHQSLGCHHPKMSSLSTSAPIGLRPKFSKAAGRRHR
jgi:Protein of unknown function (DUF1214)